MGNYIKAFHVQHNYLSLKLKLHPAAPHCARNELLMRVIMNSVTTSKDSSRTLSLDQTVEFTGVTLVLIVW